MIILANLMLAVGRILDMLLSIMIFIVIARAVISWVNPDPYNPIVRFLSSATDPLLRPLRRYIPPLGGGIDVTPIVLILILYFLEFALVQTILDYAMQLKGAAVAPPLPRPLGRGVPGSLT